MTPPKVPKRGEKLLVLHVGNGTFKHVITATLTQWPEGVWKVKAAKRPGKVTTKRWQEISQAAERRFHDFVAVAEEVVIVPGQYYPGMYRASKLSRMMPDTTVKTPLKFDYMMQYL